MDKSAAENLDEVMQAAFGGMPVESYIREAENRQEARSAATTEARLRDALVALLAAVEDEGLDAAWGDDKFKTIVAARKAVRLAS